MKKILLASITLLISHFGISQTKQDYVDYIKSYSEASPVNENYKTEIVFGSQILSEDANRFTGKILSVSEYLNTLYVSSTFYTSAAKSNILFSVIRSCDLSKVRKVATIKQEFNGATIYSIKLYMNDGYWGKQYDAEDKSTKIITEFSIDVKTDEITAKNIKKAVIALAKLSGAVSVVDGDNLFEK